MVLGEAGHMYLVLGEAGHLYLVLGQAGEAGLCLSGAGGQLGRGQTHQAGQAAQGIFSS
jgi:hypothetical protein